MSASSQLNSAYAKLRKAQNELEQLLQDLGIDPYQFEACMDEVQEVVETLKCRCQKFRFKHSENMDSYKKSGDNQ